MAVDVGVGVANNPEIILQLIEKNRARIKKPRGKATFLFIVLSFARVIVSVKLWKEMV